MPSACLDPSQKFHYVIYDVPFSSFRFYFFYFFFTFTFIFVSVLRGRAVREARQRQISENGSRRDGRDTNKTDPLRPLPPRLHRELIHLNN